MALDDALAATVERVGLTQRGTVYTGNGWATVAKSGLKCSLAPADREAASTGGDRADLAKAATLEWERGYSMPASARVVVDAYPGIVWNVQRGTILPVTGPGNGTLHYTAEVVRVLT